MMIFRMVGMVFIERKCCANSDDCPAPTMLGMSTLKCCDDLVCRGFFFGTDCDDVPRSIYGQRNHDLLEREFENDK